MFFIIRDIFYKTEQIISNELHTLMKLMVEFYGNLLDLQKNIS